MAERSADVIKRYVADAVAIEKSFETQLQRFAKEVDNEAAKAVLMEHAGKTKQQHERLTGRLNKLEGSVLSARSLLLNIFGLGVKGNQLGSDKRERASHELTITYAVENGLIAMYECLETMAEAAGDGDTAELAGSIQCERRAMAEEIWKLLPVVALDAHKREITSRSAKTTA